MRCFRRVSLSISSTFRDKKTRPTLYYGTKYAARFWPLSRATEQSEAEISVLYT